MKQTFGYFLILCSILLLLLVGSGVWEEVAAVKVHEEKMEASIHLPQIQQQLPVTLLDENGQVFSEEYVEWREPLSYDEFPKIVKDIFIYSEDAAFFDHIGFDVSAIARAVMANSAGQTIQQGGSTITQQLVRMRYLSEEKTYERKLMELFYAYELEQLYDKEEILQMYLNEMYFSHQVYGIASAATYYFGRPLGELSIAEIAFISAIPNNPGLYDPLRNFDGTKKRQERLLDTLAQNEAISLEDAASFKQQPIELHIKKKIQHHPSYSTYALQELRWLVSESEGYQERLDKSKNPEERSAVLLELDAAVDNLLAGGIKIYTALQPQKQKADEAAVNDILSSHGIEASAVVIDNHTREIVSMFAGRNYKKLNLHRAFQTPRQPGSSFKPLIDYAPAMELLGYTPASTISGAPYCIGGFCPQNYGGGIYGNVSVSTAFSRSYNTSAIRLLHKVGLEQAFSYLERFSFRSLVDEDRNFSSGLGGLTYGVTSLEMADAYTSFIDGSYVPARAIRKVTDLDGNVLYEWPHERDVVWSTKTVRHMRTLLTDVVRKGTGTGLSTSTSYIGAKTGTTNDFKDYWVAGLTENYTTAIWIGHDKPRNMQSLEKYKIHFSIFNAIMD